MSDQLLDYLPFLLSSIIILVAIFLFSLRKRKPDLFSSSPALITTLGIACTFIGITIGLFAFNGISDLEILLKGLKTAFIPSTVAILISIFFKLQAASDNEGKFINVLQEISAANKLIVKILINQYPLSEECAQAVNLSEADIRIKLLESWVVLLNDDSAVLLKYSIISDLAPRLILKAKGDILPLIMRLAAGLDIPLIKEKSLTDKIYQKYDVDLLISMDLGQTIFDFGQKNSLFLQKLTKQVIQLIEDKGSFTVSGSRNKLAALLSCSKDQLPVVIFMGQDNIAKLIIKETIGLERPVIKNNKVARKILEAACSGEALPKALIQEVGAIIGDNYATIEPYFK